ncbi:AAC(3) family N-acetyltransferase [Acrocarpospora corrugata]|uniref:Aminoglycoside N(3)-acetyltransferase n=1 Tax=Acrocarpospora corrugata TaxID=35763 RepID=A0A5M3W2V4_9ACTN|nr:AAC(3) family N-acetyltransferase [Acrocarpospora corrugata]GES01471.1 AAC(3) family N-acetyltransferase [Acrocarpospora corrugata]
MTAVPVTGADLLRDLSALGVDSGQTVLVHCSLSRIGRVAGGAATLVEVIRALLGPAGTLVALTSTADNSDTSPLYRQAVEGMSAEEVARYQAAMPAFDPARTPSTGVGRVAEQVRLTPGARRSAHPQTSFAAVGAQAGELMAGHSPTCHYGEESPLARLYAADARVLLLGVGFDICTAFHLAEYRYSDSPPIRTYRCVVDFGYGRTWWEYQDMVLDDSDFAQLGADFEQAVTVSAGMVGNAESRFFAMPIAVDFATNWLLHRRNPNEIFLAGTPSD